MDVRNENTADGNRRRVETLIRSYDQLIEAEKTARANGDARHLAATLAGQEKVLRQLKGLGLAGAPAVKVA